MKYRLLSVMIVLSSLYSSAQIKEAMMNKVGENIRSKKQASSSTENSNSTKQVSDTTTTINSGNANVSSGTKKDIEPEYKFNDNVLVEIQNYKKSGEKDGEAANIRYLFSKEANYFGTEMIMEDKKGSKTESRGIYEFDKNKMITLTDNNGSKMAMVIKYNLSAEAEKHADSNKVKVVKTGRTKTILNYLCEEYVSTDEEGNKTEMWISNKVPFSMAKIGAINKASKNNASANYPTTGFTLEMTMYDKKGVKKTTWVTKEINLNQNTIIKTSDYQFFGF